MWTGAFAARRDAASGVNSDRDATPQSPEGCVQRLVFCNGNGTGAA